MSLTPEKEIRFSGTLDEKEAYNRLKEIEAFIKRNEINVNLEGITSARPLGTMIFAHQIRELLKQHGDSRIRFTGYEINKFGLDYLAQANFFRFLNIPRDNRKFANTHFDIPIPLHDIKATEIRARMLESKRDGGVPLKLQQVIQEDCDQMTTTLFGRPEKRIAYCFREIIRNTFEHSNSATTSVMGQKYEDTDNIEFAAIDSGIGIIESLRKKFKITSPEQALLLAIKPGISGADTSGNEFYSNSGFGLYVLSEIGKRFGKFSLGTDNKLMVLKKGHSPMFFRSSLKGTVVSLNIKTNDYLMNKQIVNQIITEGESIAASEGRMVKASASSRISI